MSDQRGAFVTNARFQDGFKMPVVVTPSGEPNVIQMRAGGLSNEPQDMSPDQRKAISVAMTSVGKTKPHVQFRCIPVTVQPQKFRRLMDKGRNRSQSHNELSCLFRTKQLPKKRPLSSSQCVKTLSHQDADIVQQCQKRKPDSCNDAINENESWGIGCYNKNANSVVSDINVAQELVCPVSNELKDMQTDVVYFNGLYEERVITETATSAFRSMYSSGNKESMLKKKKSRPARKRLWRGISPFDSLSRLGRALDIQPGDMTPENITCRQLSIQAKVAQPVLPPLTTHEEYDVYCRAREFAESVQPHPDFYIPPDQNMDAEPASKRRKAESGGSGAERRPQDLPPHASYIMSEQGAYLARPPTKQVTLIAQVISDSPDRLLLTTHVYTAIMNRYPYFKYMDEEFLKSWKSGLRHTLCRKWFRKLPMTSFLRVKGCFWGLNDALLQDHWLEPSADCTTNYVQKLSTILEEVEPPERFQNSKKETACRRLPDKSSCLLPSQDGDTTVSADTTLDAEEVELMLTSSQESGYCGMSENSPTCLNDAGMSNLSGDERFGHSGERKPVILDSWSLDVIAPFQSNFASPHARNGLQGAASTPNDMNLFRGRQDQACNKVKKSMNEIHHLAKVQEKNKSFTSLSDSFDLTNMINNDSQWFCSPSKFTMPNADSGAFNNETSAILKQTVEDLDLMDVFDDFGELQTPFKGKLMQEWFSPLKTSTPPSTPVKNCSRQLNYSSNFDKHGGTEHENTHIPIKSEKCTAANDMNESSILGVRSSHADGKLDSGILSQAFNAAMADNSDTDSANESESETIFHEIMSRIDQSNASLKQSHFAGVREMSPPSRSEKSVCPIQHPIQLNSQLLHTYCPDVREVLLSSRSEKSMRPTRSNAEVMQSDFNGMPASADSLNLISARCSNTCKASTSSDGPQTSSDAAIIRHYEDFSHLGLIADKESIDPLLSSSNGMRMNFVPTNFTPNSYFPDSGLSSPMPNEGYSANSELFPEFNFDTNLSPLKPSATTKPFQRKGSAPLDNAWNVGKYSEYIAANRPTSPVVKERALRNVKGDLSPLNLDLLTLSPPSGKSVGQGQVFRGVVPSQIFLSPDSRHKTTGQPNVSLWQPNQSPWQPHDSPRHPNESPFVTRQGHFTRVDQGQGYESLRRVEMENCIGAENSSISLQYSETAVKIEREEGNGETDRGTHLNHIPKDTIRSELNLPSCFVNGAKNNSVRDEITSETFEDLYEIMFEENISIEGTMGNNT